MDNHNGLIGYAVAGKIWEGERMMLLSELFQTSKYAANGKVRKTNFFSGSSERIIQIQTYQR